MDIEQRQLWDRLQAYKFNKVDSELPLSDRLARDNEWTKSYAKRVLEEYRRFVFLALTANHPVTPSDEIDQAWHLHLLYTQEYWENFCPKILGKAFHHHPTRGGQQEGRKFANWYEQTLRSYRKLFNEVPPDDIWPAVDKRFGNASLFCRINVGDHFIFKRKWLVSGIAALFFFGFIGLSQIASATSYSSSNSGVILLVVIAFVAGIIALAVLANKTPIFKSKKNRDDKGGGCGGGSGCSAGGDSGCGGCGS